MAGAGDRLKRFLILQSSLGPVPGELSKLKNNVRLIFKAFSGGEGVDRAREADTHLLANVASDG